MPEIAEQQQETTFENYQDEILMIQRTIILDILDFERL